MSKNESLSLRFLYNTAPGRAVLKLLVAPPVSIIAGKLLSTGLSKCIIKPFMKNNGITLDGIAVPEGGFASFNDFFSRKRENVTFDMDANAICAPCDGFLTVHRISDDSVFNIKNSHYSLAELLQDKPLAESFGGGIAFIYRLTPSHYHRYHFADSGIISERKRINGKLHCVRPIATERFPVFVQNSREYTCSQTEAHGKLLQMEVGALMVGKIQNDDTIVKHTRGDEKGYFQFGGSTVIVLIPSDKLELTIPFDSEELPVVAGERIGTFLF